MTRCDVSWESYNQTYFGLVDDKKLPVKLQKFEGAHSAWLYAEGRRNLLRKNLLCIAFLH